MPEIVAYVAQEVRTLSPEQGGQVPMIALTAYAAKLRQRAIHGGLRNTSPKPIEA